ncbi:MAG TPA: YfhO family protein [Pyrinomonadaceae bacterium]|nr:YfhO family protein [Pyrinomonadaceae bacterium]
MESRSRQGLKHTLVVIGGYVLLFTLFFAPVLFSDRLLAPGDGIVYFLPNFASPRVFWDLRIWGGFPALADPQLMMWYPPAWFFSLFGAHGYQPFVLAAFVLASSFTYGYVYTLTQSWLGAFVSGAIYGLGAFMVTHLGHATVIHAAAWLPLVLWALAMTQRTKTAYGWFLITTFAVAFCALAGHPQIFVYMLCVATAYVLVTGSRAALGRWRYYGMCFVAMVLGTGLTALQLWPLAELAPLSWRAALTFAEFVAYELPLRQIPVLVFPYLYGGSPDSFYAVPYFGAWPSSADGWGAGELSGYVGLLSLILAAVGSVVHWRNIEARFWLVVALVAFLLTLGQATPLAIFIYQLPVLNLFRAPARHFMEMTFAISVLAGFGVAAISGHRTGATLLKPLLGMAALLMLGCLLALYLFENKINELALQRLDHSVSLQPLANPSIGVPLLLFVLICLTLLWWSKKVGSFGRSSLVVVILLIDLASFGWFYEWRYRAPYKAYLQAPAPADQYRPELNATSQRLLPVRGGLGRVTELPPNLSKLWELPSASGYGPFILTRVSRLLTMAPHGSLDESWRDPANHALDLMAVRYLVLPREGIEPPVASDLHGVLWSASDFAVELGPGCNQQNPLNHAIDLPQPVRTTSVALVGALACSVEIPDREKVLSLRLVDRDGSATDLPLLAGRDFSEWAHDCPDVQPTTRHGRAQVFRSYPAPRGEIVCNGNDYVARLKLESELNVAAIQLRWIGSNATFALKKITLIDDEKGRSIPVAPVAGTLRDPGRWKVAGNIDASTAGYGSEVKAEEAGSAVVFENLRARPRVWLVPEVLSLPEKEVFNAVRSSRLADARAFDPARVALIEVPLQMKVGPNDPDAVAKVRFLSDHEMEVQTSSANPAFLVTSDVFYPGWNATIDGVAAPLYQVNYALRGVTVPAGDHVVRFEYRPRSFIFGVGTSALSLVLLLACVIWWRRVASLASSVPATRIETESDKQE